MQLLTSIRTSLRTWADKKVSLLEQDIRFCERMIRDCEAEMRLDGMTIEMISDRIGVIEHNERTIALLRFKAQFYRKFAGI